VLTPAPAPPPDQPLPDAVYAATTILVPNAGEAAALVGRGQEKGPSSMEGVVGAARTLLGRGVGAVGECDDASASCNAVAVL
jgi:hypothetical protein